MLVNSMQTNKTNMQYWTDDTPTEALTNFDSVDNFNHNFKLALILRR